MRVKVPPDSPRYNVDRPPKERPLFALLAALVACAPSPRAPNLLVVSVDTLRADRVGKPDARGRSLTPNLDALAASATVFTQAWSPANETLYAHAALFTGELPSALGAGDYARFSIADRPTLASVLRGLGYRTEAVVAGGHLAPEFGLGVGFERYASGRDFGSFQQTVPLAIERMDALAADSRPWLLFVHGYDVHAPYVSPLFATQPPGPPIPLAEASLVPWTFETLFGGARYPGFRPPAVTRSAPSTRGEADALATWAAAHPEDGVPLSADDVAFVRGQYDSATRYADYQLGRLFEALDRVDPAGDTVVVVLSDHGEELLEGGRVGHRHRLSDETLHVPLIVRVRDRPPGRVDSPVSLLDLLPTLTAMAGAPGTPTLFVPDVTREILSEAADGTRSARGAEGRRLLPSAAR